MKCPQPVQTFFNTKKSKAKTVTMERIIKIVANHLLNEKLKIEK